MSAEKKKSGSAKSTTRKRSNKRKSNRRRKPKVALSTKAVFALTAVIVLVCVVFLAVSINLGKDSRKQNQSVTGSEIAAGQEVPAVPASQETEKEQSASLSNKDGSSVSGNQSSANQSSTQSSNQTAGQNQNQDKNQNQSSNTNQGGKSDDPKTGNNSNNSSSNGSTTVVPETPAVVKPVEPPVKVCPYDIPDAKGGATLVFVIDDAGQNINNLKKYTSLPFPLTVAVLPKLANSSGCAYVVRSSGKELILHQPMQSLNLNLYPGPGSITPEMTTMEIAALVKENLDEIGPKVSGINNHEGSLITENEIKIGAVLEVCQERGIYFLDSRTTAQTKAPQAALERDMEIHQRDVFLDDVVTKDAMLEQVYRALSIANKNGKAIIIGHVDKSVNILPDLLLDMYPYLVEKGYKFATPSTLKN